MPATTHSERSYVLYGEFAAGGMATVHYGRVIGSGGFARTVAVKRLHPHFAKDPEFFAMFLDEARLAVRIHHPNVVDIFDVVAEDSEVFLVMDYVHGESLSSLLRLAKETDLRADLGIVASVIGGVLHGLHAAHEAKSETGVPLQIVHRDVSPQNILVGLDGSTRVLDFGVARAAGQRHATRQGEIKGKLSYMSPEHLEAQPVDRRSDIYAAGIVCWEMLTGCRLFHGDNEGAVITKMLRSEVPPPSSVNPLVRPELDRVVLTALSRDSRRRFQTAREMAVAIESAVPPAGPVAVGEWVQELAGDVLARRAEVLARIESGTATPEAKGADVTVGSRVIRVRGDTLRSEGFAADRSPMAGSEVARRRRRFTIAGIVALVLAVPAAIGLRQSFRARTTASALDSPMLADTPGSESTPAAMPVASSAPRPPTTTAPESPPQVAPRVASGATISSAPRPRRITPRVERPPPAATARSPSCDPPYTMVAGVKLPKPECPLD